MSLLYYSIILTVINGLSANLLFNDINHDHFEDYECHTPACYELAHNIQHNMNKSMNPCIDFYEYGCGNLERDKSGDQLMSDSIQYKTYHRIHELLIEENEHDKPFIKIAKQFHRSCMNEDAIENEGLKSIKLMLNATGGWPILMSEDEWYKKNYMWQNINNIYYRFYSISSFFNLIYRRKQNETYVLMKNQSLTYPFDKILDDSTHSVYLDFMIKIVRTFADKEIPEKKLSADMKEVLKFHVNLIKIIEYRKQKKAELIMTIAQLQESYDFVKTQNSSAKINWLDMIQFVLKDVNVSINVSQLIRIPNIDFIDKFAHLLDATPQHVIVNYIQWNVVSQLMRYLNKQIRNIEFEYYPTNDGQEVRWLTCVRNFPMNDIALYIFINQYISAHTLEAVSEMTYKIKEILQSKIIYMHWMRHTIRRIMLEKIDNISLQFGYPKGYDNHIKLFDLYEKLEIGENYFKNWLVFKKFKGHRALLNIPIKTVEIIPRIKEIQIMPKIKGSTDNWPWHIKLYSLYDEKQNMMVIPAALIQDPYFTPNTPAAVNYGAIGSIIAYEFINTILIDKIGIFKSDESDVITESEEFANFRSKSLCLYLQYENYILNISNGNWETENRKEIMENIIIGLTAAQVTFTAFQEMKKIKVWSHSKKLTTLTDVTDEQLFFLSLVNTMCISAKERYREDTTYITAYNVNKYLKSIILANMDDFSDAFKCPVGSPMSHTSKCTFWK